jgi:hypothetical protein
MRRWTASDYSLAPWPPPKCPRDPAAPLKGGRLVGSQARRTTLVLAPLLVRALATARRRVPCGASHFGLPLNSGKPVLTRSVSPRVGSVAFVRAAASPNEVRTGCNATVLRGFVRRQAGYATQGPGPVRRACKVRHADSATRGPKLSLVEALANPWTNDHINTVKRNWTERRDHSVATISPNRASAQRGVT